MVTYGDGVSGLNIPSVLDFHWSREKLASVTAARATPRFGTLGWDAGGRAGRFAEKPLSDGRIGAGYFVIHRNYEMLNGLWASRYS